MRDKIEMLVKATICDFAIIKRGELELSQEKMASALVMTPRSYADIERGENSCGMLTTVLLLMSMDDPTEFLQSLKVEIEEMITEEVILI